MISNPAFRPLITELVGLYFDRGINERFDSVADLGLKAINSKGSDSATNTDLAHAARQAGQAERNADLIRVAEIAEALAALA
ncbi:hypothetical protein [Nocardia brasiliensis]|uniref:hypothetical protein n=1 Tax=Nocardia brasiliensis TaxID=37326 RepID=UPI0024574E0D|nr:hypothetical protein [Nocardia brasiliensis]